MRVLGVGHELDLGDLYLDLQRRGHEVRVHVAHVGCRDVLEGTLARVDDWMTEVDWVRAGAGLIVFENADYGPAQDELRLQGVDVVGGSAFGDRLENDRAFGQSLFAKMGLETAATFAFCDYLEAARFVASERRRFVFKPNGAAGESHRTYVGMRPTGEDMVSVLALEARRRPGPADFVLMEHVSGVEVGVGAWFDGKRFVGAPNIDWEHKRFFPGDVGELTGEMGTVASYRGADKIFAATLARLEPELAAADHRGYVNLNLIASDHGLRPLELTARFGYPGYAVLAPLQTTPWDRLLTSIARGEGALETREGIVVGVVITVPPFPYGHGYDELGKDALVHVDASVPGDAVHFAEVRRDGDAWVTAGGIGYVAVVTGVGATLSEARAQAYAAVSGVSVANMRYRNDIGARLGHSDARKLYDLGWIDEDLFTRLTS